jgi:hypothetical protein
MNAFLIAKQLLETAERRLLRAKELPRPLAWIFREFLYPIIYVFLGIEFFARSWAKTMFYPPVFMLLAIYMSNQAGLAKEQTNAVITIAFALGVVVVFFALPSTFSHSGVTDDDVKYLADQIEDHVSCEGELQAIRANLEILEEAASGRVKAMKLLLATIWGAVLFGYSQAMGMLTKVMESHQLGELISGSVVFIFVAVFFAVFSILAISGYQNANDMVFRGLQFASNQVAVQFGD